MRLRIPHETRGTLGRELCLCSRRLTHTRNKLRDPLQAKYIENEFRENSNHEFERHSS